MSTYVALLEGGKREETIEVVRDPEGGPDVFQVTIGGQVHRVDSYRLDHGTLSLIMDGQSHAVELEASGENGLNILIRESVFPLEILDERRLRLRRASGRFTVEGKVSLLAPMPGKVVKVLVSPGAAVEEGQGLVVVEAMKMENELKSPKKGKVSDIAVREGQAVEGGAKLLSVE
jgi:biotin carboxyl carrier protein